MKYTLLVIFCALSVTASAQFWKKKKPVPVEEVFPRYEAAPQPSYASSIAVKDVKLNMQDVAAMEFKRSKYAIEAAEDIVMAEAKHHMRYREYLQASYSFTDLADLYILQNRFSEAKWYLLQSLDISRSQKDDRHTIAGLLTLAAIKINLGQLALAKTDLQEAHDIANADGLTAEITGIDKRMSDLLLNKPSSQKVVLRYAEAVEKKQ